MEQKQRPIILELEEAKQELISSINQIMFKHNLSCYLLEPMFTELYNEIKTAARNELARAREAEQESLNQNKDSNS